MMMMAQGFHLKDSEDFTLSLITDPRASFKEGGLFIGAEIEYSGAVYTSRYFKLCSTEGWIYS
jgi:hypothetical protein